LISIFIHIPRTAGTYLRRSLGIVNISSIDEISKHMTFTHRDFTKYLSKEFIDDNFKFTTCRNPYDRAVSLYLYFRNDFNRISFLEFSRKIDELKTIYNAHYPQIYFLRNTKMDYITRFERIEEDLEKISHILDIKIKRTNKINTTDHDPYREYYDNESADNVLKYYKEDFDFFGYSYDLHT